MLSEYTTMIFLYHSQGNAFFIARFCSKISLRCPPIVSVRHEVDPLVDYNYKYDAQL